MARIERVPGTVSRLVDVWRDSTPTAGEGWPDRITVDSYGSRWGQPVTVAEHPFVRTPRWSRFLVNPGKQGDELLAALKAGPIKVGPRPGGEFRIDLDRIERA